MLVKEAMGRMRTKLIIVFISLLIIAATAFVAMNVWHKGSTPPPMNVYKHVRCVIDLANRTVCVQGNIKRIVSLWPEATRIVIALGAGSKLVGVSIYEHHDPLMLEIYPRLRKIPAVGTTYQPNVEEIMRLRPDLILADAHAGKAVLDRLQRITGIPVVGIRLSIGKLGTFNYKAFEIIGKLLGGKYATRGIKLERYLQGLLNSIRAKTAKIPRSKRLKVYIAFARSPLITFAMADPAESAGLINVALNPGRIWYPVSLEQIARWNPDIIAVHALAPRIGHYTVETILHSPEWRIVKAVREGRVYNVILGYVGWYPGMMIINTLQLAKIAYPCLFKNVNITKIGNEIYEKLYGVRDFFTKLVKEFNLYIPRGGCNARQSH